MTHASLVATLADALRGELPGHAAQDRMAPVPRRSWPAGFDAASARQAAGLLLMFPVDGHTHLVLTVRSHLVRHGGQVSLPGGVIEPGESFEAAALREAHEEIAFRDSEVRVLGRLTPIDIPVSGFTMHPVVAAVERRPSLNPSDQEVARILEVSLDVLLAPGTMQWRSVSRGQTALTVPAFVTEGVVIWGATAMVLAEFLTLAGWRGPGVERS